MSIVVRGARPHVDARGVSAARPVSAGAAAVGLKLADDVKHLLERAEHVVVYLPTADKYHRRTRQLL
jgi:hypothetical protein